jgi:hypothetical protein
VGNVRDDSPFRENFCFEKGASREESEDSISVLNPDQLHFSDVGFEVRQIFANEVRVLIQKSTANRLKLDLNIELENPSPRMLFINGIAHGHIASSLGSHYGFEIESENNRVELSFRDFSSPPSQWLGRIDVTWSPSPLN